MWEEASAEQVERDTERVYECLLPVLFEAGWGCGARHDRQDCEVISSTTHSSEWLRLHGIMDGKQASLQGIQNEFADVIDQSRRKVQADPVVADRIRALLTATKASFTEQTLRSALNVVENGTQRQAKL